MMTQSPTCKSLDTGIVMDELPHAANKGHLEQWRMPYEQWHRRMPAWEPTTLKKIDTAKSILELPDNYAKEDPPPRWVKPVPVTLVLYLLNLAHNIDRTNDSIAIANMICIAFYFLLQPGEYTGTSTDDHPFLVRDVQLYLGNRPLDYLMAPIHQIQAASSVLYTFTKQKNNN